MLCTDNVCEGSETKRRGIPFKADEFAAEPHGVAGIPEGVDPFPWAFSCTRSFSVSSHARQYIRVEPSSRAQRLLFSSSLPTTKVLARIAGDPTFKAFSSPDFDPAQFASAVVDADSNAVNSAASDQGRRSRAEITMSEVGGPS